MKRPRVAVITPTLSRTGGTESIFSQELDALAEHAALTLIFPRGETPPSGVDAEIRTVSLPPMPGALRTFAWIQAASAELRTLPPEISIRYAPGLNAFGLTHATVHASFSELAETARNVLPAVSIRDRMRWWRYRALARYERRVYPNPGIRLATVSEKSAALLRHRYGRKDIRVLPPAIDRRRFSPPRSEALRAEARETWALAPGAFVVLAVGNSWSGKGFDILLRAWSRADLPSPAVLAFVTNETPARVLRAANASPPRVRWLGRMPDIERAYAAADLVVLPSRGETFGLPIMEAAAAGRAVLVSSAAGVSEALPAEAVLDSLDPAVWADALCAFHDPSRRAEHRELLRTAIRPPSVAQRQAAFLQWLLYT